MRRMVVEKSIGIIPQGRKFTKKNIKHIKQTKHGLRVPPLQLTDFVKRGLEWKTTFL